MTDQNDHNTTPGDPEEPQPQDQDQAAMQVQQELDALKAEFDEQHHRLLRVSADYQNYIRRSQQNTRQAAEQEVIRVAKSLVPVLDHFDRSLEVDPDTATVESLLAGMRMVQDELLGALKQFGVQRIDVAVGEEFDPEKHEALMRQPSEEIAPNHVTAVLQSGYQLGQITIRPAKVSVAQ